MADDFIQLTTDGSGKMVDADSLTVGLNTVYRERQIVADPTNATGLATVTSSGGLEVWQTNYSTTVNTLSTGPILVLSSGPTTISGTVNVVSASSGLIQISGNVGISSGIITLSSATSLSSGTVTVTSGIISISSAIGISSGIIGLSSGTVTLSSTPLVTNTSSGIVQVLTSGPTVLSSVGLVQVIPVTSSGINLYTTQGILTVITGSSGAAAPATSSGGLGVTILGGAAAGSTAVSIVTSSNALIPGTSSGGIGVTILGGAAGGSTAVSIVTSSNALIPGTSSGGLGVTILGGAGAGSTAVNLPTVTSAGFATVTSSAGLMTTISSGIISLSSNITVISASSGFVQIYTTGATVLSSVGITQALLVTSSGLGLYSTQGIWTIITGSSGQSAPVTSSGGVGVTILGGAAAGSTAVSIVTSSNALIPGTSSGGLGVTILGGAAGSTAVSIVTSSNALLPGTSSGGLAVTIFNLAAPVTTSYGTLVTISTGAVLPIFVSASSGLVQISGAVGLSSGTVTLSSNPTVITASSGVVQVLTSGPFLVEQRTQIYSSVAQFATINASSSGHCVIVSAVTSMSVYTLGYALIVDTSNTISWESSNTDISGAMLLSTAGAGLVVPLVAPSQGAWLKTSVSGDLGLFLANAGGVRGHITYYTATS